MSEASRNGRPLGRGLILGVELEGTRLSPGSQLAARDAQLLASRLDLPVEVVHSTADGERWDSDRQKYVRRDPLSDAGRTALDAVVDSLRSAGIRAELCVSDERSVLALKGRADATRADLIVVGKRDRRRLGSVARSLIHDCPTAVWVSRPDGELHSSCILAAADRTPVGARVVQVAARVAPALQGELHVVHALELPLSVQFEGARGEARHLKEQKVEARRQLSAWLGDVKADLHVGLTSPTQAVLSGVRHLNPELVVMGTISRHGIPGLLVGNTAERLLDRLETSLLVIKPQPAGE